MITCKNCGNEYDGAACPNCGTPCSNDPVVVMAATAQQKKKKRNRIILIVVICFLVVGVIGGIGNAISGGGKGQSSSNPAGAASGDSSSSEINVPEVTAKELFAEYDTNEVAADSKYKGNQVKITGTISDIGKDIMDDTYITLVATDEKYSLFSVQCYFKGQEIDKVASLSKGQEITLIGTVDGMLGNVMVKDCAIQ